MKEAVGFIGIGKMGTPMARRLAQAGYPVVAFDLAEEALARAAAFGARRAASLAEVTEGCPAVITLLPDSAAVEAVVLGPGGLLEGFRPGQALIEMSTAHPASTIAIGRRLAEKGVQMLDAPVSGGVAGAEKGTLAVMVGGEAALFGRYRPLLEVMGSRVFYIGPAGTGHAMKAINNFLSATTTVATAEAVVLAMKAGISPKTAIDVLNAGTGRSYATEYKFPAVVLNGAFNSGFSIGQMHKDLGIFMRLAVERQVPTLVGGIVQQVFTHAMSRGWQDRCHTAIVNELEELCGVQARSPAEGASHDR